MTGETNKDSVNMKDNNTNDDDDDDDDTCEVPKCGFVWWLVLERRKLTRYRIENGRTSDADLRLMQC